MSSGRAPFIVVEQTTLAADDVRMTRPQLQSCNSKKNRAPPTDGALSLVERTSRACVFVRLAPNSLDRPP